ncbi:hypothetical protein CMI47_03740 [Candidatus Pacearchaeota archaeon]|nr:hypothetical protein [Candidatus Pacearchaeota archaeon]
MAEHTPGPWGWGVNPRPNPDHSNHLVVRPAGEFPHGEWVADVGRLYDPQAEANARLIAGAPLMLEALRRIGYEPAPAEASVALAHMRDIARAAIAQLEKEGA